MVGARGELLQLDRSGQSAGLGLQRSFSATRAGVQSISEQLARARTELLAFLSVRVAGAQLGALIKTADEVKLLDARLRLATKSHQEYAAAQAGLFEIAQRTRTGLAENITLYGRTADSIRRLGGSQKESLALTEAVSMGLQISGASATESSAAMLQFSQAMASGVLRGDEFNSMSENGRRVMQAVADGLGVNIGRLRAMAEAGELTSEKVFRALLSQLPKLQAEFAQIPTTVAGAMTQIRNQFLVYVGSVDSSRGATNALIGVLGILGRNFEAVANTAIAAVTALAAAYIGRGVGAVQRFAAELMAKAAAHRAEVAASTAAAQAGQVAAAAALKQAQAHVVVTQAALAEAQAHRANVAQLAIYGPVRAAAERQVAAAAAAHAQATAGVTAAQAALATAGGRVAGTMGVLRGALAVLGGPIGAITTALTLGAAAWLAWGARATEAVDTAQGRLERLRQEEQQLKTATGQADIDELNRVNREIADLMHKRDAPFAGDDYKAQINDQLKVLQETQKLLGLRIQRNVGPSPIAEIGTDAQKAKDSLDELIAKLRDQTATTGLTEAQTMRYRVTQGDLAEVIKTAGVNADEYRQKLIAAAGGLETATQAQKAHEEALREQEAAMLDGDKLMDALRKQYDDTVASLNDYVVQLEFEAKVAGLSNEARERAIALRELENRGIKEGTELYADYAARIEAAIRTKSAREAAAEIAQAQQREWEETVENIDETFHDGFVRMLENGKGSFKSWSESLRNTFKSTVADYIYKMLAQPFVLRVAASFAGMIGLPAPATAAGQIAGQAATTSGGLSIGGLPLSSIFTNNGRGFGSVLGDMSWQNIGANIGAAYFGNQVGSFFADRWGGGKSGGNVGSVVGGTIGSIWGPIGSFAGSAIGNFVGSFFGGGPSNKSAGGTLDLATGRTSNYWNMTGDKFSQQTVDARNSFFDTLKAFTVALQETTGGKLRGSVSVDIGQRDGTQVSGFGAGRYADPQAAFNAIVKDMVSSLTGVSSEMRQVLGRIDTKNLDQAVSDLQFASDFLSGNLLNPKRVSDAEVALKALNAQFDGFRQTARRLGLDVAEVNEAWRRQRAELLGEITKPLSETVDRITFAEKSPMQQFSSLRGDFTQAAKDLGTLDFNELLTRADELNTLAEPLLALGKDVYASGPQFQSLFKTVVDALNRVQALIVSKAPTGSHAAGLPYVPYDGYIGELHRGEAVIDAGTMQGLRRYGIAAQGASDNRTTEILARIEALLRESDQPIAIRVITTDGRVLTEHTLRELKRRSARGEIMVHAEGVRA